MTSISDHITDIATICDLSSSAAHRDRLCDELQDAFERLYESVLAGETSTESLHLGLTKTPDGFVSRRIVQSPNFRFSVMCRDPSDPFSGLDLVEYSQDHNVVVFRAKLCPALNG